ncbi:MAG: SMP-30/gluconolactonase/LRE family protein, partial [Chloroflexota bacterium]
MQAEPVLEARAILGEGPAWHQDRLYWVDILARQVHCFHPESGQDDVYRLDEPVGCLAPSRGGGLVMALRASVGTFSLPAAKWTLLASLGDEPPTNRFNDGKCDPAGRFLAGTMDMDEKAASGSLYSFRADGSVTRLLGGIRISNGLAWSADYRTLYYIDTPTRTVMAYPYDLDTGKLGDGKALIHVPPALGWPDGMTSDREGNLWIALWGGSAVSRWTADGKLAQTLPVPARHVTSCVFGGESLTELYVTSARAGLNPQELDEYP